MANSRPVMLMVRELGIGGCERDLAKIAMGLDRARFEPHVGCFRSEGLRTQELRDTGIPIVALPVRSFMSWKSVAAAWEMKQYLRKNRIQLVHCFDGPTNIYGVPVARLSGTPVVISSQLSYRWLNLPREHSLLRFTDRIVDTVVVNSKAVQKHLIEDDRVPPGKTYLSYNGVDTQIFYPASGSDRGRDSSRPLVAGIVAALRPEKQIHHLMEAFAQVRRLATSMKLLIVGSGPESQDLAQRAAALGITESTTFEPAKTDVADWMRAIDIFVQPSRSESFPNALLEAMACGCCVIGSNAGGIPELIVHEESGLVYPAGDVPALGSALARVIENPGLRTELASQAAIRARDHFSMAQAVERTEQLYLSLLHRRGLV